MFTYIFGGFQTIWYVVLCNFFLEIFIKKRNNSTEMNYGLWIGLTIGNYIISIILADNIVAKQIVIILLTSIVTWRIFQQSYLKMVIVLLLYQAGCIVVEYTTLLMINQSFGLMDKMKQSEMFSSLWGLLCQLIVFCLILCLKKHMVRNDGASLTELEWIRFSVFPLFTICAILTMIIKLEIYGNGQQGTVLVIIACGLLLMNVMIYCLMNDIMKREVQLAEHKVFYERMKNETQMYHSISENYEKQKKKVHEFNNHMTCIMALAQKNEYDKLKEYLGSMKADMMQTVDMIDTNHTLINALLNTKYYEAREKGITFVFKVNDLSKVCLTDEDIVIILSNLMNNAFEACEKSQDKIVRIKVFQEERQLIISVINTCAIAPICNGEEFQTTKIAEKDCHGVGIKNVKEVVEKYQGTCAITYDKKQFKFSILIPKK